MKKLCHYISEYMGVLVLAAALLALVFPGVLQQVRPTVINYMLGVVMFGMGLTLNLQDFKIVFSRPKDVIIGCLAQFTVMPLLAWGLARLFSLDEALALGVVLVGCCPGGTASNVIYLLGQRRLGALRRNDRRFHLAGPVADPFVDVGFGWEKCQCRRGRYVVEHSLGGHTAYCRRTDHERTLAQVHRAGNGLSASILFDSHCHDCCHYHCCQRQQAVGRRIDYRPRSDAPQHLRTQSWLSDWPSAGLVRIQETSHIHRGGYAKFRVGQQSGNPALCGLSVGHYSWRHFQRMA